ncbi:MAG: GNAT family N-acetyltransferase [Clostridia bacterium]|nr:GNAT family N-acetyltransferase [Clostridia bacterium]
MQKSELKTERLRLAALRPQDTPALIALLTDPSVTETYMVPPLETEEAKQALFERIMELSLSPERFVYGIFLNDAAIGLLNETDRSGGEIELGYAIDPAHRNRGYGSEAMRSAIKELLGLGFSAVRAGAFIENKASIRVMEKCGMHRTDETETITYRGREHTCCYYRITVQN